MFKSFFNIYDRDYKERLSFIIKVAAVLVVLAILFWLLAPAFFFVIALMGIAGIAKLFHIFFSGHNRSFKEIIAFILKITVACAFVALLFWFIFS